MKHNHLEMKEHHENLLSCGCGHCGNCVKEDATHLHDTGKSFFKKYSFELFKIGIFFAIFFIALFAPLSEITTIILFLLAGLVSGFKLIVLFIKNLIKKDFLNENTLMLIASVAAFCMGEYFESVLIIVLYNTGELLEHIATDNSRRKIVGLSELKVNIVHLLDKDGRRDVLPEQVEIGCFIEIRKGERVPIDGILVGNTAEFDLKAITGESKYYTVENGEIIYSGAINVGEAVVVKTVKLYQDSTVEKIISMVEGSLSKKAKSEKFITSFARVYTPIIFVATILISVIPPLFDSMNFVKWIYKALSFLVISCPCALVISVPLSFFIGIGSLAKVGILVKGSSNLESLALVKTAVFDKTGTLTKGNFKIDNIVALNTVSIEDVTDYAVVLEAKSSHPIAKAISEYKEINKNLDVTSFLEIPGRGVAGKINGKQVFLGSFKLLSENGVAVFEEIYSGTILYVSVDGKLVGKIYISDQIKENAKLSLKELKQLGITENIIISGDNKLVVKKVADELCIDKNYYELLPNEKVNVLREILGEKQGKVLYAGDGINDSPALAVADVGIAMGGLGSEIVIESADVVIMDDNICKIPASISHARKVRNTVIQNIVGSLAVKLSIMFLSLITTLPVWLAMFADVGVMLLAVLNSLKNCKIKVN